MHDSVVNKVAAGTFCLSDVFIHSESILCAKYRATHERPPITRPYQWLRGDRSTRHRSTRDICKFRFFFFFIFIYLFIYFCRRCFCITLVRKRGHKTKKTFLSPGNSSFVGTSITVFVLKHCFPYLNVQQIKQRNSFFK